MTMQHLKREKRVGYDKGFDEHCLMIGFGTT